MGCGLEGRRQYWGLEPHTYWTDTLPLEPCLSPQGTFEPLDRYKGVVYQSCFLEMVTSFVFFFFVSLKTCSFMYARQATLPQTYICSSRFFKG
jgi:hypothetical protein